MGTGIQMLPITTSTRPKHTELRLTDVYYMTVSYFISLTTEPFPGEYASVFMVIVYEYHCNGVATKSCDRAAALLVSYTKSTTTSLAVEERLQMRWTPLRYTKGQDIPSHHPCTLLPTTRRRATWQLPDQWHA